MMPHTSTAASRRAAIVSIGQRAAQCSMLIYRLWRLSMDFLRQRFLFTLSYLRIQPKPEPTQRREVYSEHFLVAGIKWALVLLVILNLLQLNLLYFSSNGSTRCILKAALATRARTGDPAAPPAAPVLPGSPLGSYEQLGNPVVGIYAPVLQHAGKEAFLLQVWHSPALPVW